MQEYSNEQLRRNERYSIYNGNYSMIGISLVNNFTALFAISALHANDYQVGLLNSIPSIVGIVATLLGAVWMGKVSSKKTFCVASVIVSRIFYLALALIPFLPSGLWAWTLVILIGLMKFPQSFVDLSWQSFIGDLIPEKVRGDFFGNRNRIITIVGMVSTLLPGIILQQYKPSLTAPYQVLFFIAFVSAIFEIYYLLKHYEPRSAEKSLPKRIPFGSQFKQVFREKPYVYFLISSVVFNFGWQTAWPLFNIYQIHYAHATAFWISLFTVANQMAQILSYRWWGRMADRHGNGFMLIIATLGMGLAPVMTILSTNLIYLTVTNLVTGLALAGINLLLFNQLLAVSTEDKRTSFIANYNIVIGAIGFIAPQFGVWLLVQYGMTFAMLTSTAGRVIGSLSFLWVFYRLSRSFISHTSQKTLNS